MKANVERSVEVTAYGQYGQRDGYCTAKCVVKTVDSQPEYVWIGNDRYNHGELVSALAAVRPDKSAAACGLYAPGTK